MKSDDRGRRQRVASGIVVVGLVGLGLLGARAQADRGIEEAATATVPAPVSLAPSPPTGAGSGTTAPQLDFSPVADRIFALAGPGFAGLIVHEGEGRIVAYWAGEIPQAATDYAATSPAGIAVELNEDARFTRSDLKAAAERITQSELGRQVGVSGVAAKSDGSGLGIDLAGEPPTPAHVEAIAQLAGLPNDAITYTPFNPLVPLAAAGR